MKHISDFADFLNDKLVFVLERLEEEGILHHLALQELENRLRSATEDFQSCLRQKDFMIHSEKQRNQQLELMVSHSLFT